MNEDDKLKNLFETQFDIEMEHNPIAATFLGYKHEKYDHLLPDGSVNAREDSIIRALQQKRELEEKVDYELLSEEGKLDYDLLKYFLELQLFQMNELAIWKAGIQSPIGTIGTAIYGLYSRDFAPISTRVSAMINRLKLTPQFLEETKSIWYFPVELWVNLTIEEGPRTIGFLQLIQQTLKPNLEPKQHQELVEEIENASEAIKKYIDWVKSEVLPRATHDWVIGSQKFARLMQLRRLDKSFDEILAIGEKTLEDTKKEIEELAKDLYSDTGAKTVEEVRESLKNDHPPTFEMVLEHVRDLTQIAREFIHEKNLMSLPEKEELIVIPTPSFLVPILPFAALFPPEKFSEKQVSQYVVTPIEGRPEMLREHSYASLKNVAVHE
ncbi:MAG: DUF885 family protein, partial [Candidatus Hodarchaeota archaeon]